MVDIENISELYLRHVGPVENVKGEDVKSAIILVKNIRNLLRSLLNMKHLN
jgi:hypothetical protein